MIKNYTAAVLIGAATCFNACSGDMEKNDGALAKECGEERAQVHIHDAKIIDQRYELKVSLPQSYRLDAQRRYPVVYILDGQWNSNLASSVYGSIAQDGQVPEAILVSITWYEPGSELQVLRERDLLPAEPGKAGGAARFLSTLEMELISFIDATYRSSGHRVLVGHSLSGAFVAFALFEKPAIFDGYVSVAAPFSLLDGSLSEKMKEVKASSEFTGKRFYIGKGALDLEKAGDDWLEEKLRSGAPAGLHYKSEIIDSVGHSGVNALAMTFGFQHVFLRPRLDLSKNFLSRYEGKYSSSDGPPDLQVTAADGRLILKQNGLAAEAFPLSNTEFYVDGVDMNLVFAEATISGYSVRVKAYGGEFKFQRGN